MNDSPDAPTIGAQLDAILDAEDESPEPPEALHKYAPQFDGCAACMFVYGPHCSPTCIYHPDRDR